MRCAIEVAQRGWGQTSPNPIVGAVLVDGDRIVATGHHARFGGPHAERRLLSNLADASLSRRSVLYLTLEPCSYRGKTPPCVDILLESPIRRYVIATTDPNPRVRGRGIAALRKDGRDVRVGLLATETRALNPAFYLSQQRQRARVTLKIASTLDGRIADSWGVSKWITGTRSLREVARLRAAVDAILVGSGTVRNDDPRLASRPRGPNPSRIVLDRRLRVDPDCRLARLWRREVGGLVDTTGATVGNWIEVTKGTRRRWIRRPRLILATGDAPSRRTSRFQHAGWEIWRLPERNGRIDLPALVRRAAREGLIDLLVEPGPRLAAGFLGDGPVDRILLFLAPIVAGGDQGWSAGMAPLPLASALELSRSGPARGFGRDLLLDLTGPRGRPIVSPPAVRNRLHSL